MCEIFPEVESCVGVPLRIGMLLIAVATLMTGVIMLSIMEKKSDISYDKVQNVTHIQEAQQAVSASALLIPSGVAAMAVLLVLTGLVLLFATLADDEGLVQVFVWLTFAAVLLGFVLVLVIAADCLLHPVCILSDFDWLSGSALLLLLTTCLFIWIYFITVANSYVLTTAG